MDSGVGTILREARNRREVELSEVESATRIRLRYLHAIESEEWDVLPGGVYTRAFIRTYGSFLGLDGDRLVEDYRAGVEQWSRPAAEQAEPSARPTAADRGLPRLGPAPVAALAVLAVLGVAAVAILAIPGGGGEGPEPTPPTAGRARHTQAPQPQRHEEGVSVRLAASAEVWVCVIDGEGDAVVDGQILEAGSEEGPFHSGSFTVSFGNGEVSMRIDGREAEIPATSGPIGYAIDSAGGLTQLGEAERPTCT